MDRSKKNLPYFSKLKSNKKRLAAQLKEARDKKKQVFANCILDKL